MDIARATLAIVSRKESKRMRTWLPEALVDVVYAIHASEGPRVQAFTAALVLSSVIGPALFATANAVSIHAMGGQVLRGRPFIFGGLAVALIIGWWFYARASRVASRVRWPPADAMAATRKGRLKVSMVVFAAMMGLLVASVEAPIIGMATALALACMRLRN